MNPKEIRSMEGGATLEIKGRLRSKEELGNIMSMVSTTQRAKFRPTRLEKMLESRPILDDLRLQVLHSFSRKRKVGLGCFLRIWPLSLPL